MGNNPKPAGKNMREAALQAIYDLVKDRYDKAFNALLVADADLAAYKARRETLDKYELPDPVPGIDTWEDTIATAERVLELARHEEMLWRKAKQLAGNM